jgi:hypothetical protein
MTRPDPQIVKLLFGPYQIPKFHRGARVLCQLRDHDVIVTGYTNARIFLAQSNDAMIPVASPFTSKAASVQLFFLNS